jgi:hypothetical protein
MTDETRTSDERFSAIGKVLDDELNRARSMMHSHPEREYWGKRVAEIEAAVADLNALWSGSTPTLDENDLGHDARYGRDLHDDVPVWER